MPLSLYCRPSFNRSIKRLGSDQKKITAVMLEALLKYYATDCNILEAQKTSPGFFYKKLRTPYYEAGIESNIRVVIRKEGTKCIALLAGNHDQIRQFLAHN